MRTARRGGGATNRHSARSSLRSSRSASDLPERRSSPALSRSGSAVLSPMPAGSPLPTPAARRTSRRSLQPMASPVATPSTGRPPGRLQSTRPQQTPDTFRRAVQDKLAQQSASLRKAFRRLDKDHSGALTEGELRQGLSEVGFADASREMEFLVRAADSDGNGSINYAEFAAAMLPRDVDERADAALEGRQYAPDQTSSLGYAGVRKGAATTDAGPLVPAAPATARTRARVERQARLRTSAGVKDCIEDSCYDLLPQTPGGTLLKSRSRSELIAQRREELRRLQEASVGDDAHLYRNHRIRHFLDTGDLRFPEPIGAASKSGIDLREFNDQLRKRRMQTLMELAQRMQRSPESSLGSSVGPPRSGMVLGASVEVPGSTLGPGSGRRLGLGSGLGSGRQTGRSAR